METSKNLRLCSASMFALVAAASVATAITPAAAQDTTVAAQAEPAPVAQPEAAPETGEIVVTARKRSENILRTPIAVTALSGDQLAIRGATSLNDVANFTPGVTINNNAAGRNDRSFQQIIIRGFTPSAATNPTVALFIDGVAVSSPTAFLAVSDPERVEILKGPQSAYFGRNTFAGAINVVNKEPGNRLAGSVSGMVGTRENYKLHGDIGGALIEDKLLFRVSLDQFSKSGSYRNAFDRNQTLGDQKSTSGSAMLIAKPVDGLTIKAFGLLSQDEDGPSAQAQLSAYEIRDAAGNLVAQNQSNCTLTGRSTAGAAVSNPFFCGVAPRYNSAISPSANTTNDAFIKSFLANPTGRVVSPKDGVKGYGLLRRYYHLHLNVDYDIGDTGFSLSSLTGYNNERYSQLADLDNFGTTGIPNSAASIAAGGRSYFDYPFLVERVTRDFSQEFRASYDQNGPFKGSIGVSYLDSWVQGSLGGGNGGLGTTTVSVASGATKNDTLGAFFGGTYKFNDVFSLSAEGRYQIDKLYAYAPPLGLTLTSSAFIPAGTYAGGSQILQKDYKNFMPRVIAQAQVTPEAMFYASFSKGVNPGLFNTAFLSFSPAIQALAAQNGIKIEVAPERVTNYELGFKGRFFDNKLRFSLAAYYAPWRNQINAILFNATDANGVTQPIRGSANTGSVNMKGIEIDGTFNPVRQLDLNFAAAINDSTIQAFQNAIITQLSGLTNYKGKENPNTSKYSATAGAQYNGHFGGPDPIGWFVRGDYVFKSGVFSDAANLVRTPDMHKVNARVGITHGPVSIDGAVSNLFNNRAYTTIADNSVLTSNFRYSTYNSGLVVGLPDLRTFTLTLRYKF
ncbi:TonB-dependent receptor [Sphingomonas glacialis]|uniref:TonB-dependent receptor n=2 Tax=Sphingomonas glacialis TaxID=658225 RepID=A0A502FJ07_9SPHN|nr:TonB-dependent receptor [Sphingomonas glacialis]